MRVLLIRNYTPDGQHSMLAFAGMLAHGLRESGHEVAVAEPKVRLGKQRNTVTGPGKWLGYVDKYCMGRTDLRRSAQRFQPDVVHICDHSNAVYLPLFQNHPCLLTCNDLLAVRIWKKEIAGQSKSLVGGLQQRWIFSWIRQAENIVCVSDKTREDLLRLAPETASSSKVIPMGLNHPYRKIPTQEAQERILGHGGLPTLFGKRLTSPFLLHVGGETWYKNRMGTLRIWRAVRRCEGCANLGLVFVGAPPSQALREAAMAEADSVAFVTGADNAMLEALYNLAECFLFPSLAEGFGWPPVEAQACGCPVAVSLIEPLKSNCPNALHLDPQNECGAGQAIADLLMNPERREALSQSGLANARRFSPDAMIAAYTATYQEILDKV